MFYQKQFIHFIWIYLFVFLGEYECDTTGLIQKRNLTVLEARLRLHEQREDEKVIKNLEKVFFFLFSKYLIININFFPWIYSDVFSCVLIYGSFSEKEDISLVNISIL